MEIPVDTEGNLYIYIFCLVVPLLHSSDINGTCFVTYCTACFCQQLQSRLKLLGTLNIIKCKVICPGLSSTRDFVESIVIFTSDKTQYDLTALRNSGQGESPTHHLYDRQHGV